MKCKCRQCGKIYYNQASHAEYTGYCKQGCMTAKAKSFGWSVPRGSRDGLYEVLKKHGEIGDVPAIENKLQK